MSQERTISIIKPDATAKDMTGEFYAVHGSDGQDTANVEMAFFSQMTNYAHGYVNVVLVN